MAYIDREAFAEKIKKCSAFKKIPFEGGILQNVVLDLLGNQPTADVEEVVRCKKCKFRGTDDCPYSYYLECEGAYVDPMEDDDFCSYGEENGING